MGIFQSFPIFYDNAGQILSAADLNLIRENVGLVDAWTYRNEPAFDSSTGVDTNTPGYVSTADPLRIWWGALRFIAGMTTLTIEGYGQRSGSEVLRVYIGGTDVSRSGVPLGSITLPTSAGTFAGSFSLAGYNDGDVVPIELVIEGAHAGTANWQISDVYATPVSMSGWPGVPTFGTTFSAASLNGLCAAAQWVYERLRLVPIQPRLVMYYNLGPFKDPSYSDPQHTNRPMYYGSVAKYYSNSTLKIYGAVTSLTTSGWSFTVYLNGVAAYSSPTYGVGTQIVDLNLSLASYTLGSRVRVAILASCTNGGTADPPRFTRWTFGVIHATADAGGWPYASLPTAFVGPSGTTTASSIQTSLNALATNIANAKARIDARPELWSRGRAVRRHYTRNGDTEGLLQARARPYFWQRQGEQLYAKGKNVKIGYGPITISVDGQANGWENYTFQHEETIDADSGATVYLDGYKGLDIGATYRVLGEPIYVAEYIG